MQAADGVTLTHECCSHTLLLRAAGRSHGNRWACGPWALQVEVGRLGAAGPCFCKGKLLLLLAVHSRTGGFIVAAVSSIYNITYRVIENAMFPAHTELFPGLTYCVSNNVSLF